MSTFTIPNSLGQTRQANRGNLGEIIESFNIDINTEVPKIKVAKKLVKVLDEATHLSNEVPQALHVYDNKYWVLTDDNPYYCSVLNDPTNSSNWQEETAFSGAGLSFNSDLTVFNGLLIASTDTNMTSWNGTSDTTSYWTSTLSGAALTTDVPHILHTHRGGQETLFVTNGNNVKYYNTTAGHFTVQLQADMTSCCIDSGVDSVWVGTFTKTGGSAYVYEIKVGEVLNVLDTNGAVADTVPVARNAYKVEGRAVLALAVLDNVPYIVTEKGNLQAFNGAGFSTVASFPFSYSDEELGGVRIGNVQNSNTARPVHPKGMKEHNRSLFININTSIVTDDYAEKTPSGIWEYNKDTGVLNHRQAFCDTATQYGAKNMERSGPILITDNRYTFLMAAGETKQGGTSGVFMESNSENLGYFITKEIESDTIQDIYESVYLKAKTMSDGEYIHLKHRLVKANRQFFDGSFADATIVNTTDTNTVAVGDEITITEGTGAGKIAHVTDVSQSATVTSLTLDTAVGTAGETVRIEVRNFLPIGYDATEGYESLADSYTSADGEVKRMGDFGTNPWVQYKVVMKGDIELRQFISKGNSKQEL